MSTRVLDEYGDLVRQLIEVKKMTHLQVSGYLMNTYNIQRGATERSVRTYCQENNIRKGGPLVREEDLNVAVGGAVEQVGPSLAKMMTGYLASQGMHVSEVRVGQALRETHVPYHQARQSGAQNLNPIPYYAEYFGHKLHMDQNEKLAMFGVTHVLAIDGFSSKIVGSKTMAVKNNLLIYDCVYRPAVLKYGMWDQVRVDHGTEFYLCLYMQERNAAQRSNTARMPYIQSQSKRNHKIERMWPEVNQRVNYPLKAVLVDMVNQDQLDMDDQLVKYCVSSLVTLIAEYGLTRFVHSWNCHRIPGHGIPNNIGSESTRARVGEDAFPSAETSAAMYAQDLGSSLTTYSPYGTDPFSSEDARKLCQDTFNHEIPDIHFLLNSAVNLDQAPLQNAVHKIIELTRRYSS